MAMPRFTDCNISNGLPTTQPSPLLTAVYDKNIKVRSCGKRESCHGLVRCQNPRPRKSSEDTTAQRVYPHMQRGQLYEQRWGAYGLPTTYDRILVTCSAAASRDHMPDEVCHWRTKRHN